MQTPDIDHDTPTTSTIYEFQWRPSENTDPHAVTSHREGTLEEAMLAAEAYEATIHLTTGLGGFNIAHVVTPERMALQRAFHRRAGGTSA